MEDGGWRLEAEARDYRCTTTSQSSIDCPFALSLPPEQKNQGGKAPSLALLATYVPSALSMASQPSPLGAPVLTSQQANLTEYSLHFTHPSPRCLSILVSCSAVTTTRQTVVLVRFCSQGDRPGHSGTDGGDKIKQNNSSRPTPRPREPSYINPTCDSSSATAIRLVVVPPLGGHIRKSPCPSQFSASAMRLRRLCPSPNPWRAIPRAWITSSI